MGWGTSTTSGHSSNKVEGTKTIIQSNPNKKSPVSEGNEWQASRSIQAPSNLENGNQNGFNNSRDIVTENQRQQESINNPNFFYNEDYFIQQALQQSLLDNRGNNNPQSDEELFNNLLKDTMVMSKKEYDDIGRKINEEEILRIKDDPEALKKKLENLLSNERLTTQGKKLPPLAAEKNLKSNKAKEKKDLSLVKAPILLNQKENLITPSENDGTNRNGNNTESEIDIKDSNNWKNDQKIPSYNPKLLQQSNKNLENDYNTFSLESNEFDDKQIKFVQINNQASHEDDEYQNLMNEMADEVFPKSRHNELYAGQETTMDRKNNQSRIINQKSLLNDSFDNLVNEFKEDREVPKKPSGIEMQKAVNTSDRKDSLDDFEF